MQLQQKHPRIHAHWSAVGLINRLTDAGCIAGGLLISVHCTYELTVKDFALASAVAIVLLFLMAEITGLYPSWRGVSVDREIWCLLLTWGVTLVLLMALQFSTKYETLASRLLLFAWAAAVPLLMVAARVVYHTVLEQLRARGIHTRRCAIVGVNELSLQLAQNIESSPETGFRLVGFFDDRPPDRTPGLPDDIGVRLGNIQDLVQEAQRGEIERIYITFPMRAESRIRKVLERLSDSTASVYVVPDFFVFELLHCRWTTVGDLPAVSVFENPFYGVDGAAKRLFDLTVGSALLLATAVPMLAIAAFIKLTSPGPIFFRQRRYGLDGREIQVWKFRTMTVCEDGERIYQVTRNDKRVTRVGAFLRRMSLDELPQLLNVLAGSMSLVGPRPHANAQNEEYRRRIPGYMLRHKVKPGITGLAQVSGFRGETDTLEKMENRVACDRRYISEWSLWQDVKILCKTIFVVWSRENAY
jgi:putative colanic acid biosynthesis UDP-glucose lipid carrier transferase